MFTLIKFCSYCPRQIFGGRYITVRDGSKEIYFCDEDCLCKHYHKTTSEILGSTERDLKPPHQA